MWKWLTRRRKNIKDHYATLGVSPGASQKAIQQAFWKAAQTLHPDVNPDPAGIEEFKEIVEAYQALKHQDGRNDYDARVISEFCQSYLGSFETEDKPKEKELPAALRVWKGQR